MVIGFINPRKYQLPRVITTNLNNQCLPIVDIHTSFNGNK